MTGSRHLAGLVAGQVRSDVAFQHLLIAMVITDACGAGHADAALAK
jgi:hypothetical protein